MENKTVKGTWAAAFTVASMWFGTHVGAGFATGNQVVGYFSKYGYTAAIYPILAMGLLAITMFIIMKFAKLSGCTNYKDTFRALYPKPWMEVFFEVFYIVIILAAVAGCITGAAGLIAGFVGETNYGVSGYAGTTWIYNIIITVALIVLTIFGIKLVRLVSTVLTVCIIVVTSIVVITGFMYGDIIDAIVAQYPVDAAPYVDKGAEALWRGVFVYCAFQLVSLPSMIAGGADLNLKGVKRANILGWIMNGGMLALSGAMLAKWYPLLQGMVNAGSDVYSQFVSLSGIPTAIPNLTVLTLVNIKWIVALYSILLFCAFISTSVTLIYSMIDRFTPYMFPKAIKNAGVRSVLVGVIVIGICLMIAPLGLTKITTMLYGYDGYYALVVIVIPAFVWGLPKIKKLLAEKKAEA